MLHAGDRCIHSVCDKAQDDEHGGVEKSFLTRPDFSEKKEGERNHNSEHNFNEKQCALIRRLKHIAKCIPAHQVLDSHRKNNANTTVNTLANSEKRGISISRPNVRADMNDENMTIAMPAPTQEMKKEMNNIGEPQRLHPFRYDEIQRAERRLCNVEKITPATTTGNEIVRKTFMGASDGIFQYGRGKFQGHTVV